MNCENSEIFINLITGPWFAIGGVDLKILGKMDIYVFMLSQKFMWDCLIS